MFKENVSYNHEANKELRKYIYRDNNDGAKIIFECEARGILEADELYKDQTGQDPRKQNYIGCSIDKIDSKE